MTGAASGLDETVGQLGIDSFVAARLGRVGDGGGVWFVSLANADGSAGTGQASTFREAIAAALDEYKAARAARSDLAKG